MNKFNKLFKVKLWKILAIVLSTLLAFFIAVTSLATQYASKINSFLNLHPYEKVETGNGMGNTEYFATEKDESKIIAEYDKICKQLEAEGLVLLKNEDSALPLDAESKDLKVSVFGAGSVNINASGQGARQPSDKDILPTLKTALESIDDKNDKIEVNTELWNFYDKAVRNNGYGGYQKNHVDYINEVPWADIINNSLLKNSFNTYSSSAIVVFTRDATEGVDISATGSDGANGNYLALSKEEYDLIKGVSSLKVQGVFDNVVVLLNAAVPIQLDFLYDEQVSVDSCLWIGNVGSAGIYSVAEILSGKVNPSGRLTDTFLKDNFSSPAMASCVLNDDKRFANKWNDSSLNESQKYYGIYVEGIYVGYRYYETRYTDIVENRLNAGRYNYEDDVAFAFGHGLSYTEFEYSDFNVGEYDKNTDSYPVSLTVKNIGKVAGKETVQIYLQKPYTDYAIENMMEVPAVELVGFDKTDLLQPDGIQPVTINVKRELFTSYDVYGAETYVLDAGDYYLTVAKDAHDAANNILAAKGYSVDDGMDVEKISTEAPVVKIEQTERDIKTYSVSATGAKVTNALAEGDINRYNGAGNNLITYVSRNDWVGTFPKEKITLELTETMKRDLESAQPVESYGEMPQFDANNGLTLIMLRSTTDNPVPYDDENWDKLLDQLSFEDLNTLLSNGGDPFAISSITLPELEHSDGPTICKEKRADKKPTTERRLPCEGIWASTFNRELISKAGNVLAADAVFNGNHGLYAPGVNIHRMPYGGRAHEYFSEDPYLTGIAAAVEIRGMSERGVISYPKHFVFNDQEDMRGGISVWLNEQSAREIYLKPWKYIVNTDTQDKDAGNAHALMSSFNRVGCTWSSASSALLETVLREEFGFEGYVLTDAADSIGAEYMKTIDGITEGTDIWLSAGATHNFNEYKNNATVVRAMRESAHRILYNVCNYCVVMNGYSSTMKIIVHKTWWEITLITSLTVLSVAFAGSMAMLVISKLKERQTDG